MKRKIIAFGAGLLVIAYVQLIHQLGIRPPYKLINKLISPVSQTHVESNETIREKLELKDKNVLKLSPQTSIISQAEAFEEKIEASSYIVLDQSSGQIIGSLNPNKKRSIASITKIMTAIVALDLASPDELFSVSKHASSQIPTILGIPPGQKLTVEELLNAIILTSANDASEVLKEGIDKKYGEGSFIWAMNEKAKILGLSNTSFSNPQGFDSASNFSTAEDIAVLSDYALRNYRLISEIAQKDYEFLPQDPNHKQFDLYNWNGLLGVYPGVNGLKIGNTQNAGTTTVVTAQRNGKKMIVVVMGTRSVLERDLTASKLLDKGFLKYGVKPIGVTEAVLLAKYSTWKYWN